MYENDFKKFPRLYKFNIKNALHPDCIQVTLTTITKKCLKF